MKNLPHEKCSPFYYIYPLPVTVTCGAESVECGVCSGVCSGECGVKCGVECEVWSLVK